MTSGAPERDHKRFSPSQAERFFACPGSTNLLARVPARPSSPYAVEGTKAHTIFEEALKNGVRDARTAHLSYSDLCFEKLDDGQNLFYHSIDAALNYVYAILDEEPGATLYTECEVQVPCPAAPGEADGWSDVAIYTPHNKTLYVVDYKHGAGVAKAAKDNPQVKQYAGGFVYGDNSPVNVADIERVALVIVQPRAYHPDGPIREDIVTTFDLLVYLDELNDAVTECLKPDAVLNPGVEQCRFCDANTMCPAREARAAQVVATHFQNVRDITAPSLPDIGTMDLERLGFIRKHASLLRKFLDDVDQRVNELLRAGYFVPGAKLVQTHDRRKWYNDSGDEEETIRRLCSLADLKREDVVREKLVPITTAEKLVVEAFKKRVGRGKKKQAAEDARQAFAFLTLKQSSGNLTVVDEDDERPAVNQVDVAFANVKVIEQP